MEVPEFEQGTKHVSSEWALLTSEDGRLKCFRKNNKTNYQLENLYISSPAIVVYKMPVLEQLGVDCEFRRVAFVRC